MASTRRSARLSTTAPPSSTSPLARVQASTASSKTTTTSRKTSRATTSSPSPKPCAKSKKRKAPPVRDKDGFATPSTPKRKRTATQDHGLPKAPIPETPTPAEAKQMSIPYSSGDIDDSTPPPPQKPLNRLADPLASNATLISPMTSRLVSHKPSSSSQLSPSKLREGGTIEEENTTTETILTKALKHLISVDPRLKPVIETHHCRVFAPEGLAEVIDPFRSLASGIISQQVSGAAAKSIKAKFVALFKPPTSSPAPEPVTFPPPSLVATTPIERLRTAGLSQRKAEYIHGLARKFVNGELTTEFLLNADYEEVVEELVKVRGLGRWSVEMFACFGLKRFDVFSTGDLGVQRGMAALEGRDVSKLKAKGGGKWKYMSEKEMLEISSKFAPYRSIFMWYMWRVEDVDNSTFEA